MRFSGKTAIVTGAASGIGATSAVRLAAEGASVVAVDINERGLKETQERAKTFNCTIEPCLCDVTKDQDVARAVALAASLFGTVDILVNSAGVSVTKFLSDVSWQDYARVMDVNMGGTLLFTRAVLPRMKERRSGAIVNIASSLVFEGYPGLAVYTASKGAIVAFSRSVSREAVRFGIRVNCVCPGATDTPIFWEGETDIERSRRLLENVGVEKSVGRLITSDEIANGVLFLASDEASAVVGSCLVMDAGYQSM